MSNFEQLETHAEGIAALSPEQKEEYARLESLLSMKNKAAIYADDEQELINFMNIVGTFATKIKVKYPEVYVDYPLWHVLAGSTPKNDMNIVDFDFPDDLSIRNFIDEL